MDQHKVIIIIPVYKQVPDEEEKKALRQALKLFARYPLKIVGPDDISFQSYHEIGFTESQIERQPSRNFAGISAYNKWLCSKAFYQNYQHYTYILIFQTDAWVFQDQLEQWCDKGFDYVGSPWLWRPEQTKEKITIDLWPLLRNQIGNGGVSLRKIRTMIKYAGWAQFLFKLLHKNEDFIWLLVSRLPGIKFQKPSITDALRFCIEMHPEEALRMTGNTLPFTAHAYIRYGREFWKQYISHEN